MTTKTHRAKRAKQESLNKKKIIICIFSLFIIFMGIYFLTANKVFSKNEKAEEISENTTQDQVIENVTQDTTQEEEKKDEISDAVIPEKMGKYEVLGQLVIDKIGLTKNILNISENDSLKLSVAKLYGPNLNSSGNFCISGHNWKNMLKRLSEMQEGDTFYIINRKTKTKVNYKIYKMYTCVPEDLSCLDQNSDGKREVTIITCNPGGLTRLICKARET